MLILADTNWLKAKPMWRASSVSGYPTLRDDWFHLEPHKIGFHNWIIILWMVSSKSGYPTLRDDWFHLEPQGNEILQLNNKNLCGGHRQAVKTMDCGSIMRGFESHCPPHLYKKDLLIRSFLLLNFGVKN